MSVIEKLEKELQKTPKPEKLILTQEEYEEYVRVSMHGQPISIYPHGTGIPEVTWDERTYKGIPVTWRPEA